MISNDKTSTHSAGNFSEWLRQTREAQLKPMDVDVPCGDCRACCTSSYFIHIKVEEKETLANIPKVLLFPAPGLPKGNMVLGFDENGHCPMFVDNECSIYENRPQTCRTFDCRLFTAVGVLAGGEDKRLINQQTKRWHFDYPSLRDHTEQHAVKDALSFLQTNAELFPDGFVPENPTQLALMAIKVYHVFLTAFLSNQQRATDIINELQNFDDKFGH